MRRQVGRAEESGDTPEDTSIQQAFKCQGLPEEGGRSLRNQPTTALPRLPAPEHPPPLRGPVACSLAGGHVAAAPLGAQRRGHQAEPGAGAGELGPRGARWRRLPCEAGPGLGRTRDAERTVPSLLGSHSASRGQRARGQVRARPARPAGPALLERRRSSQLCRATRGRGAAP